MVLPKKDKNNFFYCLYDFWPFFGNIFIALMYPGQAYIMCQKYSFEMPVGMLAPGQNLRRVRSKVKPNLKKKMNSKRLPTRR